MGPEKTLVLILKILPLRETSVILHCFTEKHGLVHAIAKGARSSKKGNTFLERGFLCELNLYIKPHRELHTVGSITVVDYFTEIRHNIIKTGLRDAAFELVLDAIKCMDEHPELFSFFMKFLKYISITSQQQTYPAALWLFYYRFSQYMGFALDIEHCVICTKPLTNDAYLNQSRGGLECNICNPNINEISLLPFAVISYLRNGHPQPQEIYPTLIPQKLMNISHILAKYCSYHFESHPHHRSLHFLQEMVGR